MMSITFDRVTNVVTLLVCALIAGLLLQQRGQRTAAQADAGPVPGDHVSLPRALVADAPDYTLIMALREDCRFCQESLPFYKRIIDRMNQRAGREQSLRLAVVTTDDQAAAVSYLSSHGVIADRVVSILPSELKG